tara:strand:- start:64 stop:231 length:168 start_codon:yes stop_codon:yes gene_type:complete
MLTAIYLTWKSEVIKLARAINVAALEVFGNTTGPIAVVAKAKTEDVKPSRRYVWK